MTQRSDRPVVGQAEVVSQLTSAFEATDGGPRSVLLAGPAGRGRRRCVERFIEGLAAGDDDWAQVRLQAQAGDDAVRTLLRVFGALVAGLTGARGFGDGGVGDALDGAAESASDERVKAWLTELAENVRSMKTRSGGGDFKLQLPRDNPWLAMLYAFEVLGSRTRWVIDLHDLGAVTSPSFWTFLAALIGRARSRSWKMLFVVAPGENLYSESPEAPEVAGPAGFLRALFSDAEVVEVPTLSAAEVAELIEETYRPNSFPEETVERLHALSEGHPELLHELLDALEEDETITWDDSGYQLSDLDDLDLDVLVPLPIEDDEDDEASSEDEDGGEATSTPKTEAGPSQGSLMEAILHAASFEGQVFSASAIRSALEAGEDDVDDALDAMPHIVEEGAYHKALGTWTYRFRYDFYRTWYANNPPERFRRSSEELGRRLATVMMQSYAPAAFEYIPRAARIFSQIGDDRGARNMLTMAVGADRPELLQFAIEVTERFADSPWPPELERLLFTRLADRAVTAAPPEGARVAVDRARAWAESQDDRGTLAWLGLLDCRLAVRGRDFPGARALGEGALAAFKELGESTRVAETLNQLAMVALNQGDDKGGESYVKQAQKASSIPPVRAHSQYIQGLILKRKGQVPAALACFDKACELSEQSGNLVLSLEALLNRAECGLMTGRGRDLAPGLERALEMSRALRSPSRERIAARLLCQAEAARGRAEAALEMARHALKLTRELGGTPQEAVDLYHCGLFSVLAGNKEEGLDFLEAARAAAQTEGNAALLPEILFNVGQVKMSREDWSGSRTALDEALGLARARKDRTRELRILEHLGVLASSSGDHTGAATRFKEAADRAVGPQAKQFRKELRKRVAQEQRKARQAEAGSPEA